MARAIWCAVLVVVTLAVQEGRQPAPATFELDEATVAQLQDWMQSGRYTARRLARVVPAAHRGHRSQRPDAAIDHRDQSGRADHRRRARRRAQVEGTARTAPRHSGRHQGQHRHRRSDDDHRRLAGAAGLDRRERRVHRRTAARGGRGDPRQDEPERVGEFPIDEIRERLERTRRSGQEPVRARSQPVRVELGTGAAIAANLAAIGVGTETDGSIVCPSGVNALVGIKPTVGLVSRSGHHSDLALPGHGRTDDANRRRRGGAAERARRAGSDGRRDESGAAGARLHEVPRRRRAQGQAYRHRAQEILRLQSGRRSRDRRSHRRR